MIYLPNTTNGLQGVNKYFLDQTCIPHMQNLSSAMIKDCVDVMHEILCDTDVSLAKTKRVYL